MARRPHKHWTQGCHEEAREALTRHIPFYLRGEHTLQIELDGEGLRAAEQGLSAALDIAKRVISGEPISNSDRDKNKCLGQVIVSRNGPQAQILGVRRGLRGTVLSLKLSELV